MNTNFGYILMGSYTANISQAGKYQSFHLSVERMLVTFWETEEISGKITNLKENASETYFNDTYKKDDSEKYVMRSPFL